MAARRADWIAANGPCVDCRSWDNPQVDHVDASAKVTHRVWSWSKERREAELAKCVVRCGPCHAKKTTASREHARGEAHGSARLTAELAKKIKAHVGLPQRTLATMYGVSQSTVRDIRSGRTWKDL